MILSFCLIVVCGIALGGVMNKLKLPSLVGMLLVGIVLSPYALNLIAPQVLNISGDIRQIALVIILLRAGLAIDIRSLKSAGRPSLLMCCVPALIEIGVVTLLAPLLFEISYLEAAILGTVLGAVSPAIIVPRMLRLIDNKQGTDKHIPQIIMTGASVDDILVIVLFLAFVEAYSTGVLNISSVLSIPVSIVTGIALGAIVGITLAYISDKLSLHPTSRTIVVLGTAVACVALENSLNGIFPISGLLAILTLGYALSKHDSNAQQLVQSYGNIWRFIEIFLFVLVGTTVDIQYTIMYSLHSLVLIVLVVSCRIGSVWLCLIGTNLNNKEKLFCAISYIPKATVQATIGAIPLAIGIPAGNIILTVAILSIVVTAPIGALGMDLLCNRLLTTSNQHIEDNSTN
jgi:NhaP-type Na+/H+ or K+/H+ antiporter